MKTCPCCGYTYSLFNYHLKVRILPETDRPGYKSLHCLICNQKIKKEESIKWIYIKTVITFLSSIIFSDVIRSLFHLWTNVDSLVVNIPFIATFYILIYCYDFYFTSLVCYKESAHTTVKLDSSKIDNIYGVFGEKEKGLAKQVPSVIFWILTILVFISFIYSIN